MDGDVQDGDADAQAVRFDDEPDHGLTDPAVRAAWTALLAEHVPAGASVLDLGCGTGSLSVLLAERGHPVTGVDSSAAMLRQARAKAVRHRVDARFLLGDAAAPVTGPVDVVLVRHVLWALPDPGAALDAWLAVLRPGGRLVLVEGRWGTGVGIRAAELLRLLAARAPRPAVVELTDPALWGRAVNDERYLIVAVTSG